jgi:hypothetical protein
MEGTKSKDNNKEGTPPLSGRALPNLINAVSILKSKPHCFDFDFDFNIFTAFIRLSRAGPRRGPGALHIIF